MEGVSVKNPLFRSESSIGYNYYYPEQSYTMIEKRQVFLRSYQFCRKKSLVDRIKGSLFRVKKVVWLRLRSARRLRLLIFSRLKRAFYYRRSRFSRLFNAAHCHHHNATQTSSCLW
ncbi:uncharacterized protein LOC107619727 [Arachis ipaensis]|uniref:Uncharacterized protein n=2 Tax=Arachis hypogaea TaxID=3818 RepID=A0A444XJ06_ARAHY|nr:uncharacterized protein LOC107619727 [Arachis ipaensis]XP_025679338.1 uncharacterized protein LOC112779307 [Arachis hypogaea]QHN77141.1 uncharacterized protein DS421_19g650090 [Arachis hypogaea]QHN77142.1 uncharacterized protein DS421_19g650090 [Arachis hypogaea]RYQ89645.1 hypothetical protein Ahy_B09g096182 isoform A [Arachis hypogaea]